MYAIKSSSLMDMYGAVALSSWSKDPQDTTESQSNEHAYKTRSANSRVVDDLCCDRTSISLSPKTPSDIKTNKTLLQRPTRLL